jgi:hypothetical protein
VDRPSAFACGPSETAGPRSTSLPRHAGAGRAGSPLCSPGFPIQLSGVGELRAAFLTKAASVALDGTAMQEIRVRSSRDDKVEDGGTPRHEWRWIDRFKKLIRTSLTLSRLTAIRIESRCGFSAWCVRIGRSDRSLIGTSLGRTGRRNDRSGLQDLRGLFVPQCGLRLYGCCTTCGNPAGKQRYGCQEGRHRSKGDPIVWRNSVQHSGYDPRCGKG